jgi:hypothetical protein
MGPRHSDQYLDEARRPRGSCVALFFFRIIALLRRVHGGKVRGYDSSSYLVATVGWATPVVTLPTCTLSACRAGNGTTSRRLVPSHRLGRGTNPLPSRAASTSWAAGAPRNNSTTCISWMERRWLGANRRRRVAPTAGDLVDGTLPPHQSSPSRTGRYFYLEATRETLTRPSPWEPTKAISRCLNASIPSRRRRMAMPRLR